MVENRFIQIGGKRFSAKEFEKQARQQAAIDSERRINETADAIKSELQEVIRELNENSSKKSAAYIEAMGSRRIPRPAAEGLYVSTTISGSGTNKKINLEVLSRSSGEKNAFNALDSGTPPRVVPDGKAVVFPRYEGNIVDEGVRRPIHISIARVRYGEDAIPKNSNKSPLVILFGRNRKHQTGYRIRGIKAKNLYARVIASLKRAKKYIVSGSGKDYTLIIRSTKTEIAGFAPENLVIKVKTS